MLKKFISIITAAAIFMSIIPFVYAENENEEIDTKITFADEYSVVGDNLSVKVELVSSEEKSDVPVLIYYGNFTLYGGNIDINTPKEDKYSFEEDYNIMVGNVDVFTVTVNNEKTEKEIVKTDAFEIENAVAEYKNTVTESEIDYLEYSVKATVKNNHNVKAEKLVLNYDSYATEEFETEAKSETEKTMTVKIKKSDITGEKFASKLKLSANGEAAAETDIEFANPYFVSRITVNNGKKITLAKDETISPTVTLMPEGTLADYEISSKDEKVVSVGEDKKSITGVKTGNAEIEVKAGGKTGTAKVEVSRSRTTAEPENIKFYYYKDEDAKTDKTELVPSEPFNYANNVYVMTLPEDVSNFKLYYEITGGKFLGAEVTKSTSGKTDSVDVNDDDGEKFIQWSSRYEMLSLKFKDDDSSTSVYKFTIGNAPKIVDFPKEVEVYSDFDKDSDENFKFTFELTEYIDDVTEIKTVEAFDENGTKIGKYYDEGKEESKKIYWKYDISKETKEGTKQKVTFKFKNKYGMETVKETKLVYTEDEEDPEWTNDVNINISSITSSSATVKWAHATDNDQISYYVLHCYKSSSSASSGKTSKVRYDSTEKPSDSISSLSSKTSYKVYIEAFDRTGNSCKSKTKEFTTSSSGSSSGSGGGSSSSGSGWSGSATTKPSTGTSTNTNVNTGTTNNTINKNKFNDIEKYGWAKKEIEALVQKKIVSGISESEFGPAMSIRRCDFILLLSRAYGFNGTFKENFADVDSGAYYAQAVGVAKALGILTGMGNNEFNPNGYITRQDMCVMALRAMKAAGKDAKAPADLSKFADYADIAEYAKDAIGSLVAEGIINGDENGNVNPRKNTTRAEAAVIIHRLLGF